MGTEAGKVITIYVGIIAVRTVNALWHSIGFPSLASGLYYSVLMIGALMLSKPFSRLTRQLGIHTDSFGWRLLQMVRTFLFVRINRVFFMANGIRNALRAFRDAVTVFNPQVLWNGGFLMYCRPFKA